MDPAAPLTIPEDLAELDESQVIDLGDQVRARIRELAATPTLTRGIVDEMSALRGDLDRVNTRAAELEDEANDLEEAAAAALNGLDDAADTEDLAAKKTDDEDDDVDADAEDGEDLAAADESADDDAEVVEAAGSTVPISQRDALAALRSRQATTAAGRQTVPVAAPAASAEFGVVAAQPISLPRGVHIDTGSPFEDLNSLSDVICQLSARNARTTMTGRQLQYVGHVDLFADSDQRLMENDPVINYALLNDASDPGRANDHLQSLVASGALCPPDNPMYNFIRYAVPQAPVEAALPTVAAPRGGIRYIRTPDFRSARAAIGTRTTAENANPNTPDKPCSRAVCPPVSEAYVTAVSECVRWDNLTYRAFPELVANYMADVAVNFASVKECLYLTAIDSQSTATDADMPTYGAMRALAFQLRAAASGYRKRQNMPRTSQLVWYAPNWLPDVLISDMVNDHSLGLDMLTRASESLLGTIFSNLNITPVWYNDQAACSGTWYGDLQAWRYAQGAGDLNMWPHQPVSYLHAPGEFVRLDSGSLDVGLVRDSSLNATNDLELFMEQWVGVVHLGLEAIKITHTICPNGTAPEPVAEMACTGFAS